MARRRSPSRSGVRNEWEGLTVGSGSRRSVVSRRRDRVVARAEALGAPRPPALGPHGRHRRFAP